eukprot:CAMPEP_0115263266 /NCGR_PEP_ID=MMETSP0270-20121206/49819_1 /TAXON_ID=71861 /ORGANISM="Scrippsiella trochoidea, Strain CCMP3099" /LENGTH=144 /DNA_ID=CAMNT_0002679237 /DNA_START=438 /DNA_END=869 /DNA_ORIENTATION=-
MLTEPRVMPVIEGRQDADNPMEPRSEVEHGEPHFHWLAVRHACNAHAAPHGLDEHVIGGALLIGTSVAETGDAAINQPGELLFQLLVAQPIFVQGAGLEILDQHVAVLQELLDDSLAGRLGEIQGDALLVPVATREVSCDVGVL